jgi:hypothetical protein
MIERGATELRELIDRLLGPKPGIATAIATRR